IKALPIGRDSEVSKECSTKVKQSRI
ncbi:MAG: hypothetical protein RLZZ575_139, partial [Actinomycetota bacterium]